MNKENPAIPAQAATPGNAPAVVTTPSSATPAPTGGQGNNAGEGSVTITLKEYRELQRSKARTLSFDKRAGLHKNQPNQPAKNPDGTPADPDLVEALNKSEKARQDLERKNLQSEVRGKVRDLLEVEEFKSIPKSTKDLILKNPAMLSEADNLEEAMLDIEDFLRDQVLSSEKISIPGGGGTNPTGHQTPPVLNNGNPAPVTPVQLEDVSKLHGVQRSTAVIRNKIKESRGIK